MNGRDRQADGQVHRHDDGDALDRLAGLVQRGVGDRRPGPVADRHRERAVLGQVEVLAGHRRHDHAQRLRQHDQPGTSAGGAARARGPPRTGRGHRQDAGAHDLGDEGGGVESPGRAAAANTPGVMRHAAAEVEARAAPGTSTCRARRPSQDPAAAGRAPAPAAAGETRERLAGERRAAPGPAASSQAPTRAGDQRGSASRRAPGAIRPAGQLAAVATGTRRAPGSAPGAARAGSQDDVYQKNSCSSSGTLRMTST